MSVEMVPFGRDMIPQAAELLALRQRRCRQSLPELPEKFECADACARVIRALLQREYAEGVAAVQEGRLRGYLIGEALVSELWGRSGWIRLPGCALAPDEDAELARDLYAALAARWVEWGCYNHFALVPPQEQALVHQWFSLSFGIEQIHGLMALDSLEPLSLTLSPGVEIRRVTPEDRAHCEDLSDVIWRHQVQAPVWGIHLPERQPEARREYGELANDPEATLWIAFYEGKPVGLQGYFTMEGEEENLLTPEPCVELGVAGNRDWARGLGIGTAMTHLLLTHAREAGYRFCLTDWRSTNLLSSRFWPRRGFRPAMYRLVRRIDPRIAWAGEHRASQTMVRSRDAPSA